MPGRLLVLHEMANCVAPATSLWASAWVYVVEDIGPRRRKGALLAVPYRRHLNHGPFFTVHSFASHRAAGRRLVNVVCPVCDHRHWLPDAATGRCSRQPGGFTIATGQTDAPTGSGPPAWQQDRKGGQEAPEQRPSRHRGRHHRRPAVEPNCVLGRGLWPLPAGAGRRHDYEATRQATTTGADHD